MSRFKCQFAVGETGQACSGTWRVWSARNKPDLYIACLNMGGQTKASIHAPNPPKHPGWRRHYGFDRDAKGEIAKAVMRDSGRHKILWPGCPFTADHMLEWRVTFLGSSLAAETFPAPFEGTTLISIPSRLEQVEVAVIVGPPSNKDYYPRDKDLPTHLLAEGRLSDGRRVWVVYVTKPLHEGDAGGRVYQASDGKGYAASLIPEDASLRAAAVGPQADGSLGFWDLHAERQGPRQVRIDTVNLAQAKKREA